MRFESRREDDRVERSIGRVEKRRVELEYQNGSGKGKRSTVECWDEKRREEGAEEKSAREKQKEKQSQFTHFGGSLTRRVPPSTSACKVLEQASLETLIFITT